MKNSLISYLLGFFFLVSCFKANSHPNADSAACLEIDGIVLNANEGAEKNCTVELLCFNNVVETIQLKNNKKKIKFYLKKDVAYTIRISKKDHITKLICIDTRMSRSNFDMYVFSFETRMIPESMIDKEQRDYFDFPVALIYYDARKDSFVHDKEYSKKLNKELAIK